MPSLPPEPNQMIESMKVLSIVEPILPNWQNSGTADSADTLLQVTVTVCAWMMVDTVQFLMSFWF
jgi:hypothetical protein